MNNRPCTPEDIISFWFSEHAIPLHFKKDQSFDEKITVRFHSLYLTALEGGLDSWRNLADGSLAMVILLDQFPRNMFREDERSFQSDEIALEISKEAIRLGYDEQLPINQRVFLYMPFMHSEDASEQEQSVLLYRNLGVESSLAFAIAHRDIIHKFGRFPHRNNILKRKSTPEESEFLKKPGSSF